MKPTNHLYPKTFFSGYLIQNYHYYLLLVQWNTTFHEASGIFCGLRWWPSYRYNWMLDVRKSCKGAVRCSINFGQNGRYHQNKRHCNMRLWHQNTATQDNKIHLTLDNQGYRYITIGLSLEETSYNLTFKPGHLIKYVYVI